VPELVEDFRAGGLRSYHVDHAFDPRVLEKLKPDPQLEVDFAFVGSIVKLDKFHIVRERLLLHLVERMNLEIWSDLENTWSPQERESSARKGVSAAAGGPRRIGTAEKLQSVARYIQRFAGQKPSAPNNTVHEKIVRRAHPPVYGLEMLRLLRRSRVVFNNHIDISHTNASNMRLFEATGVGACLVTDRKQNLSTMFEPEKEVLTYNSAEECVEKVKYILDHEAERLSIAVAGQARTLSDHNFDLRAAKIDEVIRSLL
jgi:spore maturation protein CgeB